MDPSKSIGKIKEQVEREHITRRRYPLKWGKLVEPEVNKFYHQSEINRQLKETLKLQDLCPFKYTGEGESYLLSRGMYNALCTHCRCARPRTEAHMLRCLQKERDKFAENGGPNDDDDDDDDHVDELINNRDAANADKKSKNNNMKIPKTSNAAVGFVSERPKYQQWEQSMRYISPVYDMPGFRITARPYNAIKIG